MLKIEIMSTATEVKKGISGKNRPYEITSQIAYLHKEGEPYPMKMKINLQNGQPPYIKGFYTLSDESFYIDGFSSLNLNPVLVTMPNQTKGS
jgi:hypothetical protein